MADFVEVINGTHASYNFRANASTRNGSNLFEAADNGATGNVTADQTVNTLTTEGTNGAAAGSSEYQEGLGAL